MTHLIEILQGLDTIWVFVVVCSCMVTLTAAMPWLRHGLLRLEVGRPVSDGASDALKAVTGFMVFVVAFSLVQVQGQFRTAEDMALKEATAISTMDRALFHFGTPASLAGRLDLLAYAGSVVTDEWPLLARNQRSVKTDALFKKFAADVRLLEGETSRQRAAEGEMLRTLDNMEDMREARIAAAEFGLMPLFWWVACGLFGIILVLAFFTSASIDKTLANCGMICAIGMMLSLVLVYEDPFAGDISVTPAALKRVIQAATAR